VFLLGVEIPQVGGIVRDVQLSLNATALLPGGPSMTREENRL
jgi:hypothetical protein